MNPELMFDFKVAVRNTQCLNYGGSSCLLNYEVQKRYVIRVKTTDDGSPPLSFEKDFGIDIRDVNDKPRGLQLSSNKVKEDAKKNTLIGRWVHLCFAFLNPLFLFFSSSLHFFWHYFCLNRKTILPYFRYFVFNFR